MPTIGERLATLEQVARDARRELRELHAAINGGDDVAWDRSVRGRLHNLETTMAAISLGRRLHARSMSRLTQAVLILCALATAAAPYVIALR